MHPITQEPICRTCYRILHPDIWKKEREEAAQRNAVRKNERMPKSPPRNKKEGAVKHSRPVQLLIKQGRGNVIWIMQANQLYASIGLFIFRYITQIIAGAVF